VAYLTANRSENKPNFIKKITTILYNIILTYYYVTLTICLDFAELRKSDTGWYTCKAHSETGETSSSAALIVEAPTNHDIIFRRTPEPSTYPGPPSKPTVSDVRQSSVRLAWKENPNNGASVVVAFVVEYFSPNSSEVVAFPFPFSG